ncbi:hypothetical protein BsWGS_25274 [Bradybaena similaris]
MASCCILLLVFRVFSAGQTWRPQGRFGKRLSPADDAPDFRLSLSGEIPVEAFYSIKDFSQFKSKPRLCSLSGLKGYPLCDLSILSSTRETDDWGNVFEV